MRLPFALRIGVPIAAMCLCLQGQTTQSKDAQIEAKGMPPRATPADYLSQVQAGTVTVAAEFKGHSIPTLQGPLSTEDYVAVEVGLFGPPGARITVSADEFSLRINGKKTPLHTEPYGLVVRSVKDPEWEPPVPPAAKSKGGFSGGGGGGGELGEPPPAPPPIPIGVQRAMAQRVQKVSLLEGDRALPQAGLIYFEYRGRAQGIRSVELIYTGPAGKATLKLQP